MQNWRQREIAAGDFKARCLQLMDDVNRTGIQLIITKRGKPVAKLVPVDSHSMSPFGWMEGTVTELDDIVAADHTEWREAD